MGSRRALSGDGLRSPAQMRYVHGMNPTRPRSGSVEAWAFDYVTSTDLAHKLTPTRPPKVFQSPAPLRLTAPGRPPELAAALGRVRPPRSLESPRARAKLLHSFFHHELQAAELMCWALLAFSDAEIGFRRGLIKVCLDEIRHMDLYRRQIERLGFKIGDFKINDWFWRRVPSSTSKVQFVALMGMGLEAANLEHAPGFAQRFLEAGDVESARAQQRIGEEEVPHVRFAVRWFERWRGEQSFTAWRAELPPPLSPLFMRGAPLNREVRTRAGMRPHFMDDLERWQPAPFGP